MERKLKIGSLELEGYAVLAPMAGITNSPMRRIARALGASAVWSEMISADGLVRAGGEAQVRLFRSLYAHPSERPFAVQLFGSEPEIMARAGEMVAGTEADIVDINMGCPVRKVVSRGAGAGLMKDLARAGKVIEAVKKAIGKTPLTVKMRSGIDEKNINADELCFIAQESGADAVIIHPRTQKQGFKGKADWSIIRACVEKVKIPVIGNGDIKSWEDARQMLKETGCSGVMIARGALGNPWIFKEIKEQRAYYPSLEERREVILKHFFFMEELLGEKKAVVEMRKHIIWYTKGMPGALRLRQRLSEVKSRERLLELVEEFFAFQRELTYNKKPSCRSGEMGDKGGNL